MLPIFHKFHISTQKKYTCHKHTRAHTLKHTHTHTHALTHTYTHTHTHTRTRTRTRTHAAKHIAGSNTRHPTTVQYQMYACACVSHTHALSNYGAGYPFVGMCVSHTHAAKLIVGSDTRDARPTLARDMCCVCVSLTHTARQIAGADTRDASSFRT